jgi:hypothetical protein
MPSRTEPETCNPFPIELELRVQENGIEILTKLKVFDHDTGRITEQHFMECFDYFTLQRYAEKLEEFLLNEIHHILKKTFVHELDECFTVGGYEFSTRTRTTLPFNPFQGYRGERNF